MVAGLGKRDRSLASSRVQPGVAWIRVWVNVKVSVGN